MLRLQTILLTRLTYVARLTESAKGLEPFQGRSGQQQCHSKAGSRLQRLAVAAGLQRRLLDRTAMEGIPFTGMMIVWPAVVVHILEVGPCTVLKT